MSTATTLIAEVATTLSVGVGLVGWSLFWSRVARMHYSQGDLVSTAFTTAAFVLPAIGALVWYVGRSLEIGVIPTRIDVNVIGS